MATKYVLNGGFDYPLYSFTSPRKKGIDVQLWKDFGASCHGTPKR